MGRRNTLHWDTTLSCRILTMASFGAPLLYERDWPPNDQPTRKGRNEHVNTERLQKWDRDVSGYAGFALRLLADGSSDGILARVSLEETYPSVRSVPMSSDSPDTALSAIWTGVADSYDAYRPRTPSVLLELLPQLAGVHRPHLVVDLGSGTGLSTYAWSGDAEEVIGIEPNADMRRRAEAKRRTETNVRFVEGVGHETGLPDASADLVTASQALHWMDLQLTFAEVNRILRPGGIFAAYDYDWPVIITPETDLLYAEFMARLDSLVASHDDNFGRGAGDQKGEHLARLRESGQFRLTREISIHSEERGDAERFIGLMLSNSGSILMERGVVTSEQLDLEDFRTRARVLLGESPRRWYFSYRVRYGVK